MLCLSEPDASTFRSEVDAAVNSPWDLDALLKKDELLSASEPAKLAQSPSHKNPSNLILRDLGKCLA